MKKEDVVPEYRYAQFGPWLRNPFTDILSGPVTSNHNTRCHKIELKTMNCLEAYGYYLSQHHCKDYISDLMECLNCEKQMERVYLMRRERMRQYKKGERKEKFTEAPKLGSYADWDV